MEILLSPHSKKKPPRLEKEFLRRLGEEGTKLNCRKYRQGLLKVKIVCTQCRSILLGEGETRCASATAVLFPYLM
eukprot:scaffold109234_cov15-Tisochrysis_lutea.AAC.2